MSVLCKSWTVCSLKMRSCPPKRCRFALDMARLTPRAAHTTIVRPTMCTVSTVPQISCRRAVVYIM